MGEVAIKQQGIQNTPPPPASTPEAIYSALAPMVQHRCYSMLGDREEMLDAAQEVFLKILLKERMFRGQATMTTWVYKITTNHCLDRIRSRRAKSSALARIRQQADELVAEGPQAAIERRELIEELLRRFGQKKVQILIHLYFDEMTQKETAEVMGISERAVRKTVHKMTTELRKKKTRAPIEGLREL